MFCSFDSDREWALEYRLLTRDWIASFLSSSSLYVSAVAWGHSSLVFALLYVLWSIVSLVLDRRML